MSGANHRVRAVRCISAAAVLVALAAPAFGQTSPDSGRAFSASSPNLLGDWGGARTKLADDGVSFFFDYSGQGVYNATGGTQSLARLANQWLFGASLDLGKLVNWKDASFDITVGNRSGRDLNADAQLGADFSVVNDFGPTETWWLTEFALDQKFFDGRVSWRLGRIPAGTDFNQVNLCDFMNLAFCGTAFTDVTPYAPFFDMSRWGTSIKVRTHDQNYISFGAFQESNDYFDPHWDSHDALNPLKLPPTSGWMYFVQYGWSTKIDGMPGTYKLGTWYSTGHMPDLYYDINHQPMGLTGLPPLMHHRDYGAYIDVDQRLTDNGSGKGFSLFFNFAQSNPQTEAIDEQVNLGFKYHEPFDRPNDYIGVGIGGYKNNGRFSEELIQADGSTFDPFPTAANDVAGFVGNGFEYNFEAFYKWAVMGSISLLPDIQYVVNPGGSSQNKNALILGLQTEISF